MPSFRRRASVTDADHTREPAKEPEEAVDATQAFALAEEAEAEAAEAEAEAAAARARARAIRLRNQAQAAESHAVNGKAAEVGLEPTAIEPEDEALPEDEAHSESATDDETADLGVDEKAELAVDGAEDESEESAEEEAAPSGRRWGLVLKIVAMTLAVLCTAALVAASVLMFLQHRKVADEQRLTAEYAAAGRQSVVTLMSLDFNTAEQNVKNIIDNSTGEFKTDFENQAEDFVKVAQDSKVVTDVTVTAAAVESMDQDKAVVLVAATSRVSNSAGAKQEPRAWRLSVDLQREGGQIKMSKVEFVP